MFLWTTQFTPYCVGSHTSNIMYQHPEEVLKNRYSGFSFGDSSYQAHRNGDESMGKTSRGVCKDVIKDISNISFKCPHEVSSRRKIKESDEEEHVCLKVVKEDDNTEVTFVTYKHMFKLSVNLIKRMKNEKKRHIVYRLY